MQTEQLKSEEMLPTKFEPKVNRRFILCIDPIPSFVVKSVHTPPLVPDANGKLIPKNFHLLKVFLHCPIAPSIEQILSEALETQTKVGLEPIELKYLDPVGCVVSKWIFHGSKIDQIKFSDPDYNNSDLMECELLVSFDSLEVAY